MPRPQQAPVCTDEFEGARHVFIAPYADGDTCLCGRFYLRSATNGDEAGVEYVIEGRPKEED